MHTADCLEPLDWQVVFLQRAKGSSTNYASLPSNSKPLKEPRTSEIEDASTVDTNKKETKAEKNEEKSINAEGETEEGIASVINFLKEKIPELKLKVMKINATEVVEEADAVKQLMQEDDESTASGEDSDDDASNLDDIQGEGNDATEDGKKLDMKVFVGGILHNREDTSTKDEYVRQPAEIIDIERDSFVLHIPSRSQEHDSEENMMSKVNVAAIAAKGISELMPPDVANALWGSDKVSSKVLSILILDKETG
ncbi:executer 1 [Sarracenia purpurea var. burkii]